MSDLYHNFVTESYRNGLSVSDISEITGLGWAEIGKVVQNGIAAGTLSGTEPRQSDWKQQQETDLKSLVLIQSIAEGIHCESKAKRKIILRQLLSLITVTIIGFGFFSLWNSRAQADVLSEVKTALKKNQWVKYEINSGPFTGEIIWQRFNPEVFVRIQPSGEIFYVTQNPEQGFLYDPKSGEIISLAHKGTQYLRHNMTNLLDLVEYMIGQKFSESDTYHYYQDQRDDVIEFSNKNNVVTLRCDSLSHLPIVITSLNYSCTFEYPQNGPQDIYALGVPRDAVLTNQAW